MSTAKLYIEGGIQTLRIGDVRSYVSNPFAIIKIISFPYVTVIIFHQVHRLTVYRFQIGNFVHFVNWNGLFFSRLTISSITPAYSLGNTLK